MSTFYRSIQKCSVCGEESQQIEIGSTNAFGSPDLDLRPPEMQRSTMQVWVQECPNCGYVAADLEDEAAISEAWLQSEEYIRKTSVEFESPLSLKFFKQSVICEKSGDYRGAFFAILHAAWDCDDNMDVENARLCRKEALRIFPLMPELAETKMKEIVMRADIMRRAGLFSEVIDEYSDKPLDDDTLNKVIQFQIDRSENQDDRCYTVEMALHPEKRYKGNASNASRKKVQEPIVIQELILRDYLE